MVQGYRPDSQCRFVIDDFTPSGVEGGKPDLHAQLGTEELKQRTEYPFGICWTMDDHLAGALTQTQRRDESHQTQAVVAMQVTEQDMADLAKRHFAAAQSQLDTLATIDQEHISPEIDHLC